MTTDPRVVIASVAVTDFLRWARGYVMLGHIVGVVIAAACVWYGNTHETWRGGVAWGCGFMVLWRQLDAAADSWRAFRRGARRG